MKRAETRLNFQFDELLSPLPVETGATYRQVLSDEVLILFYEAVRELRDGVDTPEDWRLRIVSFESIHSGFQRYLDWGFLRKEVRGVVFR